MRYVFPKTIAEAVEILKEENGNARIIAGGTDLIVEQQDGWNLADVLVDICRIPELSEIKVEDGNLCIGSGVKLTKIAESPLVQEHVPALAKGAASVGCLQIGNMGTLGGNIITAQPAADAAMSVAPFEPVLEVVSSEGTRTMTMEESYAGFAKSHIDSTRELVTQIRIPCLKDNEASEFVRLELRKTLALPMLNVGLLARIEDNKFEEVRITMGPVGVGPTRAEEAEKWFIGKEVNAENIEEGSELVINDAKPRSNPLRGSKEYRLDTLPVIVKRGLTSIASQLGISF